MSRFRADTLLQDLRYGLRQLRRNPVFAGVVILTIALGVGANTAIFSVVDGILFRPLPFPEPDELVSVWTDVSARGGPSDEWLSYPNFLDLREAEGLQSLAAWGGWRPTLTGEGDAEQLDGAVVTRGMFSGVLGVKPALGRDFTPEDDTPDAPGRVILSHGFWQRAFGGDPDVVGRTLRLNGSAREVIGVMPPRFRPPFRPDAELWAPAQVAPASQHRGGYAWRAVGRLAPGVALDGLDAELRVLGARLEEAYPASNVDMTFAAVALRDDMVAEARSGLLVLLAAVALVLLIACVNVANLLLARAGARREELGVRAAMGARGGRIARQLLTESALLALVGGAMGVVLALLGTDVLVALAPEGTPRLDEVAVDARVLAVTALVTLGAGLGFGLLPALRAARADSAGVLREGARGRVGRRGAARARGLLVAGQVALALVLLVGAGLLVRSFQNLRTADLGFRPEGVLTMQVNLPGSAYGTGDQLRAFYDRFEAGLAAIPGVERVAFTSTVPLTGFDGDVSFDIEGRPAAEPGQEPATWFRRVTPAYFETMGIPIRSGRAFTPTDDAAAPPVVIINETFARRHFPGRNPVGERINLGSPDDPTWREIVGVAGDIRNFGIREDARVATYSPYHQTAARYVFPVLRTALPPGEVVPAVRAALAEIDGTLAVGRVASMEELALAAVAPDRFVAALLSLFAGLALLLAVVGLYGVVAYGVGRRLREMGVRMAVGASGRDIAGLVLRQSLAVVLAGVALGLVGALVLTRLVDGLLFGVSALDPATYAVVTGVLLAAATGAAAIPALRAARLDPVRVLAAE